MIKVRLGQLVSCAAVDERGSSAFQRFTKLDLSAKLSYRLTLLGDEINTKVKAFNEVRNDLLPKYATKVEGTNKYKFDDKNAELFNAQIDEMLAEEVTLDIEQIKFETIEEFPVSGWDLGLLNWLIVH